MVWDHLDINNCSVINVITRIQYKMNYDCKVFVTQSLRNFIFQYQINSLPFFF